MARTSRRRSHRPDRRSSRDRRERSDSEDSEEEHETSSRGRRQRDEGAGRSARDSESDRRKSTPARLESDKEGPSGLASGESSGERGKKRKERLGDASDTSAAAAANRWKGDTDATATVLEEKDMKAMEISDAEITAKPKPLSSESKSRSSKRYDGSHADRKEDDASRDESSRRRSEKESSRRASGSQQSDPKESERTRNSSGNKEYRVAMGKDSSHEVSRDKGREHAKDKDRPSGRERNGGVAMERDNAPEKGKAVDKDEGSRRDKEHRSNSETKQHSGRGKDIDVKPEKLTDLTSKISKIGCTEAVDKSKKVVEGDCFWPKDLVNRDRDVQEKSYGSDLHKELNNQITHKESNKQGKRDVPVDKEKRQEDDMDHVVRSLTHATSLSTNGSHHDRENIDRRHRDRSREDIGREKRLSDTKRAVRCSRDHVSDKFDSKPYRGIDQPKEKRRFQNNELEDRSCDKEYSDKYVDGCGKTKFSVEIDTKTKNATDHQSSDYSDDRSRAGSQHSTRVDSARLVQKSSPSSAIDVFHDEYRLNQRHVETVLPTISKERQHTTSCSSGDIANCPVDKIHDYQSVESGCRQKEKAHSTVLLMKTSQCNNTPKSRNHISAPRSSEKLASTGDHRDHFNRKGAKRSLDVAEINHHVGQLSDDMRHAANEDKRNEASSLKQTPDGNSKFQLSSSDTTRISSSLYNRSDPISSNSPGLLPASIRQGLCNPSAKSSPEDDSRVHSNDRRSNTRYKRAGDSHAGRGQGGAWNGGVPSWSPQFANGFMPFQHGPPGIQPVGQPFPSPTVFGVGPFMDFNFPRVPFHIHDSPDRFPGHGRPIGWCNPSEGPYPCRSQGWEGRNGSLGNNTSTYGRHEMDQAKTLTSNEGRVMDANKQKGPITEFIHAPKEPATSVQARGNNLSSEHCEGTCLHHLKEGMIQSHDSTRAKEDAESSRKKSPNPATNSGDTCKQKYISKLDISHDLAQPELCRHFISLLGKHCQSPCNNVNDKMQGPVEGLKITVRSNNPVDKPLFPVVADALFKKALSLYNKSRGKPKENDPLSEVPKIGSPTAPVQMGSTNFVAPETEPLVSRCSDKAIKPVKKEPLEIADAKFAGSGETKRTEIAEHLPEPIASSYVKEEDSDYAAAAICCVGVGSEVRAGFANDSSARCESLIPGCLSRIPNSPENTH